MKPHVLITGGAGFIGSRLASDLSRRGCRVRVLDALLPPAHAPGGLPLEALDGRVDFLHGNAGDPAALESALRGIDVVFHLAAALGVERSMTDMTHFCAQNTIATALLFEAIRSHPVRRVVVASSMSVYGEGAYRRFDGRPCRVPLRLREALDRGDWEPRDRAGRPLEAVPTPESKPAEPASIYALTKYDQERLALLSGRASRIPVVALRFFNVYGPGQSLANPYSGVLALFAARLLRGEPPIVFEDGGQRRDFIHVTDVVCALRRALRTRAVGRAINVGSGSPVTILEAARTLAAALGRQNLTPQVTGSGRIGDVRHCFADVSQARRRLRFSARVSFERGVRELVEWLRSHPPDSTIRIESTEARSHDPPSR